MSNITRYFHAENCLRSGIPKFEPYEMRGGTWCGVCAVEDHKTIEALMALAEDKRSAVKEITREEYECRLKKSAPKAAPVQEKLVEKAVSCEPVENPEAVLQVAQVPEASSTVVEPPAVVEQPPVQRRRRQQPSNAIE